MPEVRGEWNSFKLEAIASQITIHYNQGMLKSIYESTTNQAFKLIWYKSRRQHQLQLLPSERKLRLQFTRAKKSILSQFL